MSAYVSGQNDPLFRGPRRPLAGRLGRDIFDNLSKFQVMLKEAGRDPASCLVSVVSTAEDGDTLKRYRDLCVVRFTPSLPAAKEDVVLSILDHWAALIVRAGTQFRTMGASDKHFVDGVHAYEPGAGVRWTNSDALVSASGWTVGQDRSNSCCTCAVPHPILTMAAGVRRPDGPGSCDASTCTRYPQPNTLAAPCAASLPALSCPREHHRLAAFRSFPAFAAL